MILVFAAAAQNLKSATVVRSESTDAHIQSFYLLVEAVARARGQDPDRPRHLSKVTSTR